MAEHRRPTELLYKSFVSIVTQISQSPDNAPRIVWGMGIETGVGQIDYQYTDCGDELG